MLCFGLKIIKLKPKLFFMRVDKLNALINAYARIVRVKDARKKYF